MNGRCDTKVKQILDAIEYGILPPTETEKRLLSIIEHEINKEDAVADMSLVSLAQDLLFELHNSTSETNEEYERRINQLRQRIEATVAKRDARRHFTRRIVKLVAVAAAVVLLMIGIGSPVRWTWFESWSTPDEQQRVVQLHAVTIDLISRAIAENGASGLRVVNDVDAIGECLGFDVGIPSLLGSDWSFSEGYIQYYFDSIELVVRFTHREFPERCLMGHIVFYTDLEFAWFVFEQSHDGDDVHVNGQRIYVTNNIDKASAVWYKGTTILNLSGDVTEEEIVVLTLELIGE